MTSIELEAIKQIILDRRLRLISEAPADREVAESINQVLETLAEDITEDKIKRYVKIVTSKEQYEHT